MGRALFRGDMDKDDVTSEYDAIFGGSFKALLKKEQEFGFNSAVDRFAIVQGIEKDPSGGNRKRVATQDPAPSEDPEAQGFSPSTQELILSLSNDVKGYKDENAVLKAKISSLETRVGDLREKLDEAQRNALSSDQQDKIMSYDNSELGIPDSALSDLIDKLEKCKATELKSSLQQAAKDDKSDIPAHARECLHYMSEEPHIKVRMKLMLKPKHLLLLLLSYLPAETTAFAAPSTSHRPSLATLSATPLQYTDISSSFTEFYKSRASGVAAGAKYKCYKHSGTAKIFYSKPECVRFMASTVVADAFTEPSARKEPNFSFGSGLMLSPEPAVHSPVRPPTTSSVKPSPSIQRLAASLFIDCTGPEMAKYQTSASLMLAAPKDLTPSLLQLRSRAIHSESRVTLFHTPTPTLAPAVAAHPEVQTTGHVSHEIDKFWPYIAFVSNAAAHGEASWIELIAGGHNLHARTNPQELRRASLRMLQQVPPKSLARLRCALDFVRDWHEESNFILEWPVPPAYWSNMATDKMEASAKWLQGEGRSIAPKFLDVIAQATKSLRLPSGIRSSNDSIEPVTKVPPYQPAAAKEACFAPLFLWNKCQQLAACELSAPLGVWYMACNMDIMIYGSARSVEHMRTKISHDFDFGSGITLFNIKLSKSRKEANAKFALRNVGLRNRVLHHLTPGSRFLHMYDTYGPSPIMLDITGKRTEDITAAVSFAARPESSIATLQASFDKRGKQLYSYCGYDATVQKRMHLTMHSPHSTCDNVGQELRWPADVCGTKTYSKQGRLGRWAEGMAGGYASEPAARDQLRLRSAVVDAINSLYPQGDFSFEPTMACLTSVPGYERTEYYGKNFML